MGGCYRSTYGWQWYTYLYLIIVSTNGFLSKPMCSTTQICVRRLQWSDNFIYLFMRFWIWVLLDMKVLLLRNIFPFKWNFLIFKFIFSSILIWIFNTRWKIILFFSHKDNRKKPKKNWTRTTKIYQHIDKNSRH